MYVYCASLDPCIATVNHNAGNGNEKIVGALVMQDDETLIDLILSAA